LTHTVF